VTRGRGESIPPRATGPVATAPLDRLPLSVSGPGRLHGSAGGRLHGETAPVYGSRDALALVWPDLDRRPALIATDFDGTVSHIVMDPWGAQILPAARRALRRLAGTPGVTVAVLSGRTARDAASRARIGGAIYLGDHGLERGVLRRGARAESVGVTLDAAYAPYAADAECVAAAVAARIAEPWLVVELKGPTLTFHFRSAPDIGHAGTRIAEAVEEADPGHRFERFRGRRAFELRPPGATAKGDAMRELLDEVKPGLAFAMGDDRSDAQAFAVLREAREGGRVRGLAVGVHAHAELQLEVAEGADIVLASPKEAAAFLSGLARRLGGSRGD
jgi:trehalose 6-phosphate phosphatase